MDAIKDWRQILRSRQLDDVIAAFGQVARVVAATKQLATALRVQYVQKVIEAPGVHIPADVLGALGLCTSDWIREGTL